MNTNETAREARTRNLARLRKLTIGTAALSVAATTGFGWLAAISSVPTNAATTAYTTTTAATFSTATSASTSSSATATATAAPTVTSVSGTAHVSSGGS